MRSVAYSLPGLFGGAAMGKSVEFRVWNLHNNDISSEQFDDISADWQTDLAESSRRPLEVITFVS
eukprot:107795-Karenia_brevis.AAC.1